METRHLLGKHFLLVLLIGASSFASVPRARGDVLGVYPSVPPSLPPSSLPSSDVPPTYSPWPTPSMPVPPSWFPTSPSPSYPPSYPPSASPSPSSPSPSSTPVSISGSALLVGPATSCTGTVGTVETRSAVSTNARGVIEGKVDIADASQRLSISIGPSGSTCTDAFTGLPLPFAVAASWTKPSTAGSAAMVTVTPTTRLLMGDKNLASVDLPYAYRMVGVDASGAEKGALDALAGADATLRLKGVRMLLADTTLSSLVVTISSALAPYTTGTVSFCADAEVRAGTVYETLSSSTALDLSADGLCESALASSAGKCGGIPADVTKIAAEACKLYGRAVLALRVNAAFAAELAALPLEALALASRVAYVVQAKGGPAVAALGSNAQAVQQLISDWSNQVSIAPVKLEAMADTLGMRLISSPHNILMSAHGTGPLASCQIIYRQLRDPSNPKNTATDANGDSSLAGVTSGMAILTPGCRDSALSTGGKTVKSNFAYYTLLPVGATAAVLDVMSYLASAVFIRTSPSIAPREITADDYAAVYQKFDVGKAGEQDALPLGADFVQQNWKSSSVLVPRVFLLNLRLQAPMGPPASFMAGLFKNTRTADEVATYFMNAMSTDFSTNTPKPENKDYLSGLMRAFYNKQVGRASRRSLSDSSYVILDAAKLDQMLEVVASAVAESSALLVQLDRQVVAAAAAGQPLDTAAILQSAAKISAVQQTSLTALLEEMAAAASSGNDTALAALTNVLLTDFTGAALKRQVELAQVNMAGIPGSAGGADEDVDDDDGVSKGAIIGAVLGSVFGAALLVLIAVVIIMQVRKRRMAQRVTQQNEHHQAGGGGDTDPEAALLKAQAAADSKMDYYNAAAALAAASPPEPAARLDPQSGSSKSEYDPPAATTPRVPATVPGAAATASMDDPTLVPEAAADDDDGKASASASEAAAADDDDGKASASASEAAAADDDGKASASASATAAANKLGGNNGNNDDDGGGDTASDAGPLKPKPAVAVAVAERVECLGADPAASPRAGFRSVLVPRTAARLLAESGSESYDAPYAAVDGPFVRYSTRWQGNAAGAGAGAGASCEYGRPHQAAGDCAAPAREPANGNPARVVPLQPAVAVAGAVARQQGGGFDARRRWWSNE